MRHQLTLDYTIPEGALLPYFDALREGKALASACAACGCVVFPARTQCTECGGREITWKPLIGTARILFRTDGANGSFALVKFDGADTNSTVALINPDQKLTTGTLVTPEGDAPGLWLALTDTSDGETR